MTAVDRRIAQNKDRSTGIPCPACGSDSNICSDSRPNGLGAVRRRRVCTKCRERFTTFEVVAATMPRPVLDLRAQRLVRLLRAAIAVIDPEAAP